MYPKLFLDIQFEKDKLVKLVNGLSISERLLKGMDGTGGKVSVSDLFAYQIGWGASLIRWYEAGIKEKKPDMPGEGFIKWDYNAIAEHFYKKYCYDSSDQQMKIFQTTVSRILEIVLVEDKKGNLDKLGVWAWCTISSGKQWPLSKWIRVNTAAPYKRASQLIKKAKLESPSFNK